MAMVFIGCSTLPIVIGPGDKPDTVPPKIVMGNDNNRIWDRPNAFGPVPAKYAGELARKCVDH